MFYVYVVLTMLIKCNKFVMLTAAQYSTVTSSKIMNDTFYNNPTMQMHHGTGEVNFQTGSLIGSRMVNRIINNYTMQHFFWTGLEDATVQLFINVTDGTERDVTTPNIIEMKTLSTLSSNQSLTEIPIVICTSVQKCNNNQTTPFTNDSSTNNSNSISTDHQYWIITVLKVSNNDTVIKDELEKSLATLYRIAFQHQYEHHLGIRTYTRKKRYFIDDVTSNNKPIKATIHEMKRRPEDELYVAYHMSTGGKPISAYAATQDLGFVSENEMHQILRYPTVIKAVPYLKLEEYKQISHANLTMIFIGSSIAAVLLLLLLLLFAVLAVKKWKASHTKCHNTHKHLCFERDINDLHVNQVYLKNKESPTYIDFKQVSSNETLSDVKHTDNIKQLHQLRRTTDDLSGVDPTSKSEMNLKYYCESGESSKASSTLTSLKTAPELIESNSDSCDLSNVEEKTLNQFDAHVSPSRFYLSIPSVRRFPQDAMPRSLHKVLEPDVDDRFVVTGAQKSSLLRAGSVGSMVDPGVIGPAAWPRIPQKPQIPAQNAFSCSAGKDQDVSRSRKRFHRLLDDTFSLFGAASSSGSTTLHPSKTDDAASFLPHQRRTIPAIVAVLHKSGASHGKNVPRARTAQTRQRVKPASDVLKSAWHSTESSPVLGRFHGGNSNEQKRSVPLSAHEVERCALPATAFDLQK